MFDKDFDLKGKHASYTKFLVNSANVYKRYIDVYMVGAVIGFLHNRKSLRDTTVTDDASILAGAFTTERLKCEFLYRLIILLDENADLSEEQRFDRAFRVDDSTPAALKENMDIFHSYVYGGIEVLHEKFEECTTKDDYINKIYEVVSAFNKDLDGSSYDELINQIIETN